MGALSTKMNSYALGRKSFMAKPISTMLPVEIARELANFERYRLSSDKAKREKFGKNISRFEALMGERQKISGFKFEVSLAVVASAAKSKRFICYKDLADANAIKWNTAYRTINEHLWDLVVWSHEQLGIMVSAIIVNMEHIDDGLMEPSTLDGFVRAAEKLGYQYNEPVTFLRARQEEVFAHYCK
jgi:hypothetical protein